MIASFIITTGIGFDRDHERIPEHIRKPVIAETAKALSKEFGGCTITTGIGFYINQAGLLTNEDQVSFKVCPINADEDEARKFIQCISIEIKNKLNQESILVEEVHGAAHLKF